jgi:hypothetical protein
MDYWDNINEWMKMTIGRSWLTDDVDRLHVKIDNLNDSIVGFCFIRSIDSLVGGNYGIDPMKC